MPRPSSRDTQDFGPSGPPVDLEPEQQLGEFKPLGVSLPEKNRDEEYKDEDVEHFVSAFLLRIEEKEILEENVVELLRDHHDYFKRMLKEKIMQLVEKASMNQTYRQTFAEDVKSLVRDFVRENF